MSRVCGIDPGLHGAIALVDPLLGTIEVEDIPTHEIKIGKSVKHRLDYHQLTQWLDLRAATISVAIIENVHSMPEQGVASAFSFGEVFGAIKMAVAAASIPVQFVEPATWKRDLRLSSDKDASRRLASQTFPKFAHLWARAKDDGRAEAVLIAARHIAKERRP